MPNLSASLQFGLLRYEEGAAGNCMVSEVGGVSWNQELWELVLSSGILVSEVTFLPTSSFLIIWWLLASSSAGRLWASLLHGRGTVTSLFPRTHSGVAGNDGVGYKKTCRRSGKALGYLSIQSIDGVCVPKCSKQTWPLIAPVRPKRTPCTHHPTDHISFQICLCQVYRVEGEEKWWKFWFVKGSWEVTSLIGGFD